MQIDIWKQQHKIQNRISLLNTVSKGNLFLIFHKDIIRYCQFIVPFQQGSINPMVLVLRGK